MNIHQIAVTGVFYIIVKWNQEESHQIEEFLKRVRALLMTNEYQIQPTVKNNDFNRKYPLRDEQKTSILKALTIDDCIDFGPNTASQYPDSMVYEFIKDVEVIIFGENTDLKLYIKLYILDKRTHQLVIAISFHREGMHEDPD